VDVPRNRHRLRAIGRLLDDGSGRQQAHRLDAHLHQPSSARGSRHGESRDRDDEGEEKEAEGNDQTQGL
jgi:hypothetical protein